MKLFKRLLNLLCRRFMKKIEPRDLDDGWRLYVDSEGVLCAINRKEWSGWHIVTDNQGLIFKATANVQEAL